MGIHYICGSCDGNSTEKLLNQIEQAVNKAEPFDDGSLDIEIVVSGKTTYKVTLAKQSAQELRELMKFDFESK